MALSPKSTKWSMDIRFKVSYGSKYVLGRDKLEVEIEPIWLTLMFEPFALYITGVGETGAIKANIDESNVI